MNLDGVAGLSLVVVKVILLWGVNNWVLLVILIGMSLSDFLMKRNLHGAQKLVLLD